MATVTVRTRDGGSADDLQLDEALFAARSTSRRCTRSSWASSRPRARGTSKVKTRGEVRGGGKKPYRQKGTGRARQGSIRAPPVVRGRDRPRPTGEENYTKRVSKKLKRVALRSALSDRAASGDVMVVRDLTFDAPRTKDAIALLAALGVTDRRVLVVLAAVDVTAMKSFANLRRVHVLTVDQLNTYDVLVSDVVVFAEAALPHIGLGSRADTADPADLPTETAAPAARRGGSSALPPAAATGPIPATGVRTASRGDATTGPVGATGVIAAPAESAESAEEAEA
jgi:large subunit ribosomal protein L4